MTQLKKLRDSLLYAKEQTKKHYIALLWSSILYGITLVIPDLISFIIRDSGEIYFGIAILLAMLSITMNLGIIYQVLQIERNEAVVFSDLFRYGKYLIPMLAINLVLGIPLFFIGLLLLKFASYLLPIFIIAIVFIGIRASFFGYFIVDQEIGIWKSIIVSIKTSASQFWILLLLNSLELALLLLSLCTFGVAIIWIIPFSTFTNTYYYKNFLLPSLKKAPA